MFARISSIIGTTGRRLRQNADGSIATTFALALVPMVGLIGTAVDLAVVREGRELTLLLTPEELVV